MSFFKKIFEDTPGSQPRLMQNPSELGDAAATCDELRTLMKTISAAEIRLKAEGGGMASDAYQAWNGAFQAFVLHLAQHHGWMPTKASDLEGLIKAIDDAAGSR
jgi:hypothetical protein